MMLHALTIGLLAISATDSLTQPGVSWQLAEHRRRTLADVAYAYHISIPARREDAVTGRVRIDVKRTNEGADLIVDFQQPAQNVVAVRANARPAAYEVVNGHIVIPDSLLLDNAGNSIEIDFIAGDGSLNRNPEFLYTLFVPDRASVAVPIFDQPNLKAPYALSLEVPREWVAVANGRELSRVEHDGRATYDFAPTEPIPSYLFAFAAGKFRIEEAERGGRRYRMFHRETDTAKVARNRDAIFDLQARSLAWLEEYTGIPYPFGKFDFVLIPSFQYNGMEHPGAVLYRASSLLLDESATRGQELGRASLIAHETAHMWFGDLVTMNWFDDVWTKEVFANFMAAKVVNPSFPDVNHELRFLLAHHPAAYGVDRTAGANAIRQPLENLREAGSLYGAIIYQKAPIVMRQLEALIGEAAFREGMREYLRRHSFGNATWPALIGILDARTETDLDAWSDVWVEQAGRPSVRVQLRELRGGRIAGAELRQQDPAARGRMWPQRLDVVFGYPDTALSLEVFARGTRTPVTDLPRRRTPLFVLPSGSAGGYGRFELDGGSRNYLLARLTELRDPVHRGAAWLSLWDAMLEGETSPAPLLDAAERVLRVEGEELLVERVLADAGEAFWRYSTPAARARRAETLEPLLWRRLDSDASARLKAATFAALRSIAIRPVSLARLERLWSGADSIANLKLSEDDRTALAQGLALRRVAGWERILDRQRARIENPDRRARYDFARPALSADAAVRDSLFARLLDRSERPPEPWVIDALQLLNHPLRAAEAVKYIRPGLDVLPEIQRTGDIFFPRNWLDALLSGHGSAEAAQIVREYLAAQPELPPRLRGKVLQAADAVFRAAQSRR